MYWHHNCSIVPYRCLGRCFTKIAECGGQMGNFRKPIFVLVALCAITALWSPSGWGQTVYGSLAGTVADASGGAVPDFWDGHSAKDRSARLTCSCAEGYSTKGF